MFAWFLLLQKKAEFDKLWLSKLSFQGNILGTGLGSVVIWKPRFYTSNTKSATDVLCSYVS